MSTIDRVFFGNRAAVRLPVLAPILAILFASAGPTGCATPLEAAGPVPIRLTRINPLQSFDKPVQMTQVPDGSGDVVVVEQDGTVQRFHPARADNRRTFMDIRSRVSTGGWEEGLLSVAFHPGFDENRQMYAYYSASSPRRSVVAAYRVGADGLVRPDGRRGEVLLEVAQPYSNHNGGQMAFGPDGFLYIGLGDGGSGGDPLGHGQNTGTLLGTILRIDVDRPGGGRAYGIPSDNPFANGGGRPEIWAYGLRNPWRFSFDRETGRLYAADVGQNAVEEVNRIERGGNYGWNLREGSRCFRPPAGCPSAGLVPPITEYTHTVGSSITGGFVYRGSNLPALRGRFVFGDYSSGVVWSIPTDEAGPHEPEVLLDTRLSISAFGEDAEGGLYVLDHAGGGVYRIDPAGRGG